MSRQARQLLRAVRSCCCRFCLHPEAVFQLLGGVLVAAKSGGEAESGGFGHHAQHPGRFANAGCSGQQGQSARPERKPGECSEVSVRLRVADERRTRHVLNLTLLQAGVFRRCPAEGLLGRKQKRHGLRRSQAEGPPVSSLTKPRNVITILDIVITCLDDVSMMSR
ncbi:MAG: hypothetical protein QMD04_10990 [Anaerolineales bacterium]|nr:hypothetical protein [Anaerolineales bacterium]